MALRYWVGGTDNWDATAGTKWALTSGGAGGQAVPTSADDVFLDAASGVNTVTISATATAKSLDCTGFTGTLAGSSGLSISGSITLATGMTQSWTGTLTITSTCTLTSAGKSFTNLTLQPSGAIVTLSDACIATGNVTLNSMTINGFTLSIGGNFTATLGSTNILGTTEIILNGTGIWSSTSAGGYLATPLTISTTGTITVSGIVNIGGNVLKRTSGTLITTGSTLKIFTNHTLNTGTAVWNDVLTTNVFIITLASDFYANGTFTYNVITANATIIGAFNIYLGGNFLSAITTGSISGAANLIFNGNGNINLGASITTGYIANNITFNSPTGTITIVGTLGYRTGTLTYTSGTVDTTTNNSTLNIGASCTLNTNGINWNNVVITSGTQTLTSDLYCQNLTVSNSAAVTFTNSGGNIYISGNLLHTGTGAILGTASINLIGTGTWNDTSSQDIRNNLNINTTGTITLGTNVYYRTGTLTYTAGTVDTTTNNSTINIVASCTLNTNRINWNNVVITSGTQTLTSDLNCQNFIVNGTNNPVLNLNKFYVFGNLQVDGTNAVTGTTEIILVGNGTWSNSNNGEIKNNLTINAAGTIKLGTNVYISNGTFKYLSGKIDAKNSTFNVTGAGTTTLINCNKIIFNNVKISPSQTLLMNEFFNGSPLMPINIASASTINYNITFQDNLEKIAKFVNISNCTLTKPLQLLVITNSKRNSRNSGIRYINQSPNGIAKNEPSTLTQTTYGTKMLLNDPGMK